ncbi:MAG: MFS transporter [Acidobacteria bacterium]|nr:MFS transporter [Acidobacteriota bacterium]
MKRFKFFYGWWVTLTCASAAAFSTGITFYTLPVLYPSFVSAFGWSHTAVASIGSICLFFFGAINPLVGALCDRFGAKRTKLVGLVITGISLVVLAYMNSLIGFYVTAAVLGSAAGAVGTTSTQVLISKWFRKKEGFAVGIVFGGVGVGAVLGPLVTSALVSRYDWRVALVVLGAFGGIVILPLFAKIVRETPHEIGLTMDDSTEVTGSGAGAGSQTKTQPRTGIPFSDALRMRSFWLISFGILFIKMTTLSIIQHMVLFLKGDEVGMSLSSASAFLSFLLFVSVWAKLLIGFLSDKVSRKNIMVFSCVSSALSLLVLITVPFSTSIMYVFCALVGFSHGAAFVLGSLIPREYFGLHSLGKILGSSLLFVSLGGSLGPAAAGYIRDATGSYHAAFVAMIISALLAALFFLLVGKPQPAVSQQVAVGRVSPVGVKR